jgi:hypothetical protein
MFLCGPQHYWRSSKKIGGHTCYFEYLSHFRLRKCFLSYLNKYTLFHDNLYMFRRLGLVKTLEENVQNRQIYGSHMIEARATLKYICFKK